MAVLALLAVRAALLAPVPTARLTLPGAVACGAHRHRWLPHPKRRDARAARGLCLAVLVAALVVAFPQGRRGLGLERLPLVVAALLALAGAAVQQPRGGGPSPAHGPGRAAELLIVLAQKAVDEGVLDPERWRSDQSLLDASSCCRVAAPGRGAFRGAARQIAKWCGGGRHTAVSGCTSQVHRRATLGAGNGRHGHRRGKCCELR
mmetsp:Transcript_16148/g.41798  ORF Transcript_16148/g.41798 Transcript_16148/m.41798 type:complete len:205 (-) Transcript_16148:9-623(-)